MALAATITTVLSNIGTGTVKYVSADGKDKGIGTLSVEDFDDSTVGSYEFKLYKIEVDASDNIYITVTSNFENGTVMRPWDTVTMDIGADTANAFAANANSDYSYFLNDAALAALIIEGVTITIDVA